MNFVKRIPLILIGLLGLHLFILMNLQFTAWPEMLSYAYLRNNGFLLYKDFILPYPPFLTMMLATIYKLFGYKVLVLKVFTWFLILISDVFIYLIVRKLTKSNNGPLIGVFFYILVQPFLEGNQLWFDLAIVPFILAGFLFLINRNFFWSGFFLGLAMLTKQTTAIFIVLSLFFIIFKYKDFKKLAVFLVGPVVFGFLLVVRLISENAFIDFLNWTLVYPMTFWTKFPRYVLMTVTNHELMIILVLSLPLLFFLRKIPFLLGSFIFASFILIYPRFSFFHFQTGFAFLAIIYGVIASKIKRPIFLSTYFALLVLVITLPILKTNFGKEVRFFSKEDLILALIIKSNTPEGEAVYLLGPHSGLYVYADRFPPKPWLENFGWYFEVSGVQKQTISRWGSSPPQKIFWQEPLNGNWFDLGTYQPKLITDWIRNNYINKGEVYPKISMWEKK